MQKARVIFMGTPDFAVPALQSLAAREEVDLHLVVTQPDRPAGRGRKLVAPPVKDAADELGLDVLQIDSLRHPEVKQRIIDEAPDLIVVAAFGMILGKWILELPRFGCVNLHASLLPKYRGASPISEAILSGDHVTGVTLMQMDRGLDTGDMLATIETPILDSDTTESLTPKLAAAAAELLNANLTSLLAADLKPTPQPDGATETRQLTKDDGRIDWTQPAVEIERQIRAMWSWPRTWTNLDANTRMQLHSARVGDTSSLEAGTVGVQSKLVSIGTGEGDLELLRVQLPGGKPVEGNALLQKLQAYDGTRLV